MPLLDDAEAVSWGDRPIKVMYREGVEVWPKRPVELVASPIAWDKVDLNITPPMTGADSYVIRRGSTQIYAGTAEVFVDTLRLPSTVYTYTVDAMRGGVVHSTATASATTPAHQDLGLTATAPAYNQVKLTWTDPDQQSIDSYTLKAAGTTIYSGAAKTYTHTGRAASTTYNYTLHGIRSGTGIPSSDSASIKTPARPTTQKTVTLYAVSATSYSGDATDNKFIADNTNRNDSRGYIFAGKYVEPTNSSISYYGHQKAYWTFSIPADLRNCVSIQSVKMSVFMEDIPYNLTTGSNFYVYVHHGAFQSDNYPTTPPPGHTNSFASYHSMDMQWLGMTEWLEVGSLVCPGRTSVKEEFRVNGAHGFVMKGVSDHQSDYGFATASMSSGNRPKVQFTYTIYSS